MELKWEATPVRNPASLSPGGPPTADTWLSEKTPAIQELPDEQGGLKLQTSLHYYKPLSWKLVCLKETDNH